jgi:hypothetical protein
MIDRRHMLAALGASALLPYAARATSADTATIPDLRGDIGILSQALKMHPGLYRYNSPAGIAARIDRLETEFVAAPTIGARYLLLSRFLATIRCGHTYCNVFNQKKAVAALLFDRPTRLPFHFRWIGGAMIVTDHGGEALPRGTQVITINGVSSRDMLADLFPYARADGHNDAKRISLLDVRGSDTIEFFDVFHGLVYGVPDHGLYRLTVRLPDGRHALRDLPAIGPTERRTQMVTRDDRGDQPVWDWTMRPDGIALLTMPSWAMFNSKWDWETWLNARLDSLSGAKGLVVDLRENEGGNSCGDILLARLVSKDLPSAPMIEKIRFRRTDPLIDRYLDTWDDSFRTLGVNARDLGGGWYSSPNDGDTAVITPKGSRVTVPVAALVGPVNSSATFGFALRGKTSGLVRLFGETTGGNRRGINGGRFFFVQLPASGIEFDLPLIGSFPLTPQPDGGVEPDTRVVPTIGDLVGGHDPVLASALAWIVPT